MKIISGLRCDGQHNGFGNTIYISQSGCYTYERSKAALLNRVHAQQMEGR